MKITEILIATSNLGKLVEFREICSRLTITFSSLRDHWATIPDIPEEGQTFAENALAKARWGYNHTLLWTLADDSGLEVDALHGHPGVQSARYGGPGATDTDKVRKLLRALEDIPLAMRTARFRCVIALVGPNGREITTEGTCEGTIVFELIGAGGFGYDPVFVPNGFSETFAQLDAEQKNAISHRGKALRAMEREIYAVLQS
jgi:XTP/dITP diphosphohydrolase